MKKYMLCWLIGCFVSNFIFSQPGAVQKMEKFDQQIVISDINGRPINSKYIAIEGSPYLFSEVKYANIDLKNGRKLSQVPILFDLAAHEIVLAADDARDVFLNSLTVLQFSLVDSTKQPFKSYIFRSGFAAMDNYPEGQFAQVMVEGKTTLIKRLRKKIVTQKNELSGTIEKEFSMSEDYYVLWNNSVKRLKRDKSFILDVFSDKRDEMDTYFKKNKLSLKNDQDLANIFIHYNNL